MRKHAHRVFNAVYLAGIIAAGVFLAAQLVIISTNVVLRYGFNSGISWVEEISKDVLMTAFTFLAMAIGVRLDLHIHVDLVPKSSPAWVSVALAKLKFLVLALVGLVLTFYGLSLITSLRGSIASVPILPISLQYLFIPLGGLLILLDSLFKFFGLEQQDQALDEIFMTIGQSNDG